MSQPWRSEKVRRSRKDAQAFMRILDEEMPLEIEWEACGSWRRQAPTVGDLDILVFADSLVGLELPKRFECQHRGPMIAQGDLIAKEAYTDVIAGEPTEVTSTKRMHVDFYACAQEMRGAMLMFLTGPKALNIQQRARAQALGLKLSQNGLFDGETLIAGQTERDIYRALGLSFIMPEDRQEYAETVPDQNAKTRKFKVPSFTDPTKKYLVTVVGPVGAEGSTYRCQQLRQEGPHDVPGELCPAFKYTREVPAMCKHIKLVIAKAEV